MRDDAVERVLRETLVKSGAKNAAVVAWLEDRENVGRFLRAEDDNEHKAARRLVSMVAWMEEERPQELHQELLAQGVLPRQVDRLRPRDARIGVEIRGAPSLSTKRSVR